MFQDWNVISLRYFNPVGAHKSGQIGEDPRVSVRKKNRSQTVCGRNVMPLNFSQPKGDERECS